MKISYILLAYNQSSYIQEAVLSALKQNYSNIEFILSDDCSSDDTFDILEKTVKSYEFKKNVILNKNEKNLGLVSHINKCLQMSSGEVIVLAGGDDIAISDRVLKTVNYFESDPLIMAVSFNDLIFSDSINNAKPLIETYEDDFYYLKDAFEIPSFSGASRSFRRKVFDTFGFLSEDSQTEDSTFLLRSLLCGKCVRSASQGVFYRWHGANISSAKNIKKFNIDKIFNQYLIDTEKALELNLINKEDYFSLLKKFEYQSKLRKFIHQKNFFAKIFHGLLLFISSEKFRKKFILNLKKY